jgi:hypothetical protein
LALGILAVIGWGLWFRYRDKSSLVRALAVTAIAAAVGLIDIALESPREQCVGRTQQIAAALSAKDFDKFAANFSDSFQYGTVKKADLKKQSLVDIVKQHVADVAVWDFDRNDYKKLDGDKVEIGFLGKATGKNGEPYVRYYIATYAKDPDGQYRMSGVTQYPFPRQEKPQEERIPGL